MTAAHYNSFINLRRYVNEEIGKLRRYGYKKPNIDYGVTIPQTVAKDLDDTFGWTLEDLAKNLNVSVVKAHKKDLRVSVVKAHTKDTHSVKVYPINPNIVYPVYSSADTSNKKKYKFTGIIRGGYITALEKPDGTRNYINLNDVMSVKEYAQFRDNHWGHLVTVELTFKDDFIMRVEGDELTVLKNIETLKMIASHEV